MVSALDIGTSARTSRFLGMFVVTVGILPR